jgi:hypothetical protein
MKRLYFYNKDLDDPENYPGTCESTHPDFANLVGSLCDDGSHMPALDIDLPCKLVPSTTEGHFHLYIDHPMSFEAYGKLVAALIEAGIVEPGHMSHLEENGMTTLRPAGAKKPKRARSSGNGRSGVLTDEDIAILRLQREQD